MLTPGFSIKNDTIWPLQISLHQVGPLYYDVIQPGQSFVRDTGAVWFTVKAGIFLNEKDRITDWDVALPIIMATGGAIFTVVTAGAATYAAGALAVAKIAASVVAKGILDLSTDAAVSTITASSSLAGAGFSDTATLVVGGYEFDPRQGTDPRAEEALKGVFKGGNIALTSGGCYAGPPWPFRRELTPLRITGGPTYRRVPGKDQVELIGGALHIDTQPPPKAYGTFVQQVGTGLQPTDVDYRFLVAPNRDLFAIKTTNTGSGTTEIHVLTAESGYKQFAVQTKTALGKVDGNWEFGIASNRDVFAIHRRDTQSGSTEVHILSAEHGYQRFANQTKTALPATDGTWTFVIAHNRDIVAIHKSANQSASTEVHRLAAHANYQGFAIQTKTALHATDAKWSFGIALNDDIYAFMKNGTNSGTCELHVLAAQGNYQSFVIQTKTALHEVDDTWSLGVAGNRDVFAIRKSGGASNSTEVHVMR